MTYTEVLPLGGDAFKLEPLNRNLQLLGSVESAGLEGLQRVEQDGRHWFLCPDGRPLRRFPPFVLFRISADARHSDTELDEGKPFSQRVNTDLNTYLLGLQFRVVVFRGLKETELQPRSVQLIGVPRDHPSDERIYTVGVALPDLPVTDRVVLEVRDAAGNRLTKFHLDF